MARASGNDEAVIDLHSHTYLSDGELGVAELAWRAVAVGYRVLGISDHVDYSNIDDIVPRIARAAKELNGTMPLRIVPGAELTYVPPQLIPQMVARARELGAQYVVVHGETIVEPVPAGTNAAAIECGADILAHPGLISMQDARRAAARGTMLEITTRGGHSYTNGHVLAMARAAGARLVINSDGHGVGDLLCREQRERVARGAGMSAAEIRACQRNANDVVSRGRTRGRIPQLRKLR